MQLGFLLTVDIDEVYWPTGNLGQKKWATLLLDIFANGSLNFFKFYIKFYVNFLNICII